MAAMEAVMAAATSEGGTEATGVTEAAATGVDTTAAAIMARHTTTTTDFLTAALTIITAPRMASPSVLAVTAVTEGAAGMAMAADIMDTGRRFAGK